MLGLRVHDGDHTMQQNGLADRKAGSGASAYRGVVVALSLVLGIWAATFWVYQPSPARQVDGPAGDFSAFRAIESLRVLLGNGAPHPIGSDANVAVRER